MRSIRYSRWPVTIILFLCMLIYIYVITQLKVYLDTVRIYYSQADVEYQRKHDSTKDQITDIHRRRKEQLHKACSGNEFQFIGSSGEEGVRSNFVYDNKSKIVYCGIEKVGSTFWRRLFQILAGKSKKGSPFDIDPKFATGGHVDQFHHMPFYSIIAILDTHRKFMFVRDPFERLYSGYIDKIFKPLAVFWNNLGKYIKNHRRQNASDTSETCGHDVTFEEFVKYFIDSEKSKYMRNGHFTPMYDHCKPCQIKYDYIGKMETFEDDTLFLLDVFNFTDLSLNLRKVFKTSTKNDSIFDQTFHLFANAPKVEKCLSKYDSQKRYWKIYQIRGIIDKSATFPFSRNESLTLTAERYIEALRRSSRRLQSQEAAREQRREHMMSAYFTIPEKDLLRLRDIFLPDCEIFGYDCDITRFIKNTR